MIRLGILADLDLIDAFDDFAGDRSREIAEQRLRVYLVEDKPVAYITVVENSCLCGHPLISFLCVHPEYRRRGIASQLLTEVEAKYKHQKLFISTESNNPTMLKLIRQRNYLRAGSLAKINDDGSDEVYFHQNLSI